MTTKIGNKKMAKIKNSTSFRKRTVSQPFKQYVMKTKICSVSNFVKFFSIRLFNNVTIYKRNKKNSKKKSENIV